MNNFISVEEYCKSLDGLSDEIVRNINTLIPRVNDLLEAFYTEFPDEPRHDITSGLRTMEHHLEIYKQINAKRKTQGLPELKVPMSSRHLIGAAVDISDYNKKIKNWLTIEILEKFDLYIEARSSTPEWVHFQCLAPGSGHREFNP